LPTYKAPPAPTLAAAPPPYSWTGFHVGVGGGLAFLQAKSSSDSYLSSNSGPFFSNFTAAGGERSDLGKFGAFGTVEAGVDYQMDRFVVGAFTNFDFKNLKAKSTSLAYGSCSGLCSATAAYHNVWYKVGNSWDAGVRLGYLVTDRNLIYALGGYSGAQVSSGVRLDEYITSIAGPFTPSVGASQSGWKSGFVLGAGWESAITDHITFKVEYRYADYGKAKSSYASSGGGYSSYARQSGDITVNSVRAVLGYKF
jgi:outer membrane immunogenic protein